LESKEKAQIAYDEVRYDKTQQQTGVDLGKKNIEEAEAAFNEYRADKNIKTVAEAEEAFDKKEAASRTAWKNVA
jgi:hypothetical protein